MNKLSVALVCGMLTLATHAWSPLAIAQEGFAQNPQGVWKGEWRSESTGHRGPMKVTISPTSRGTYQARFTGRFAAVIPFAYRAELVPQTNHDGSTVLTSYKKLGPILGSYQMQTQVSGDVLSGEFQAAKDRGTIQMRRQMR